MSDVLEWIRCYERYKWYMTDVVKISTNLNFPCRVYFLDPPKMLISLKYHWTAEFKFQMSWLIFHWKIPLSSWNLPRKLWFILTAGMRTTIQQLHFFFVQLVHSVWLLISTTFAYSSLYCDSKRTRVSFESNQAHTLSSNYLKENCFSRCKKRWTIFTYADFLPVVFPFS